jgi:predicted amidohydrolase YtcJ
MPADVVFLNGPIVTVDERHPTAEAVAVRGDRIARVGIRDEVTDEIGPATRVVDLAGRALLPGLNDNHTHPLSYGQALGQIDAGPAAVRRLADLQTAFRRAGSGPADGMGVRGEWLLARGYDDSRLDIGRHPTRYELDEATGGRPAYLVRTCGHLAVANSAALTRAGINRQTPDPVGGKIDRDEHGEPTGLLRETALELIRRLLPAPTVADYVSYLRLAGERFRAYGITSVGEAGIGSSDQFAAYERLARAGELPVRAFTMMLIDPTLEALERTGLRTGFGDEWLRIGPAKLLQDGSGGGRTAAITGEYRNDPGNSGIAIYDQSGLDDRFARAHAAGFQLAAHGIGDRAIEMLLDAYERVLTDAPKADARPRIEHCGICTPRILDRMERLGVIAVPQPSFIYYLGDSYVANFTPEQLALSYPGRAWFDRGIVAAGSSDVPVVTCNPFVNLRSAVTRLTQDGQFMGPDQSVTVDEAIKMFTFNGAYASFEEGIKGSIAEGKLADLVVLDRDPRTVVPDELHTLRAEMTVLGGRVVYEA